MKEQRGLERTSIIYQIREYTRKLPHVLSRMHIKKERNREKREIWDAGKGLPGNGLQVPLAAWRPVRGRQEAQWGSGSRVESHSGP